LVSLLTGAPTFSPSALLVCLQGLKQHGPNGYLNALMMLPRNLRTMYVHAYQSYLVRLGTWVLVAVFTDSERLV